MNSAWRRAGARPASPLPAGARPARKDSAGRRSTTVGEARGNGLPCCTRTALADASWTRTWFLRSTGVRVLARTSLVAMRCPTRSIMTGTRSSARSRSASPMESADSVVENMTATSELRRSSSRTSPMASVSLWALRTASVMRSWMRLPSGRKSHRRCSWSASRAREKRTRDTP